ncbi:hypothetical protein ACFFU8_18035 [Chromobacterium piscinae]|uniref:hypothetical protein n=1 Tax=Chromobacterium piscinae TaxID=686831 RepID=UPI001E494436|nr:hypothetical protein [Chromobacterium piscinae]MCD5326784.1 hypothetical protein [Chromobacterium piscinae]
MRAVIRFYRYCASRNFISRDAPKWQDNPVVVHYFDAVGFERTILRITTDVSIPNRVRPGLRLEDGLLPITEQHMTDLLRFAKENASEELYLMLLIGFFTGARLGTITTLRVPALQQAVRDPQVPGMWLVPIGPGTGIGWRVESRRRQERFCRFSRLKKWWQHQCRRSRQLSRIIILRFNFF